MGQMPFMSKIVLDAIETHFWVSYFEFSLHFTVKMNGKSVPIYLIYQLINSISSNKIIFCGSSKLLIRFIFSGLNICDKNVNKN